MVSGRHIGNWHIKRGWYIGANSAEGEVALLGYYGSAGGFVSGRIPDRRDRKRRAGLHRKDRRDGRRAAIHRARIYAERDLKRRVCRAAGDRAQRADRGGRQSISGAGRNDARTPER